MTRRVLQVDGRDLRNALLATLFFGAAAGVFGATLNNHLPEAHGFDAAARGWLEVPRELPGFFVCLQVRVPTVSPPEDEAEAKQAV